MSASTRILVATDGGEAAQVAASHAARLLQRPVAVTMLNVITDPPGEDAGGIEGPVATPEEEAREWADDEQAARDALSVTRAAFDRDATPDALSVLDTRIEIGDAGHSICMVADEIAADVIVMGMSNRGRIHALLFGSAADHVIHHAKCPVLLVRGTDGEEAG